ncbi:mediterrocin family bacteriocin [Lacticaseibacillus jixiensis]
MKKIRIFILSSLLFLGICGGTQQVNAASYTYNSSGKSFSKAWSSTPINSATRTCKSHSAYVKNTSVAQTKTAAAGNYAKVAVTHAGSTVYYTYAY